MQVTWEADDVRCGRIVQKKDCGLSGTWMIGYRYPKELLPADEKSKAGTVIGLVSMADGMFHDIGSGTKEAVATHLNNAGYYLPAELLDGQYRVRPPKHAKKDAGYD